MDLYKINIKLHARPGSFAEGEFVPIFHRWIQSQSLPNHLLIDVADYDHVHDGPGTVLIGSEANVHIERSHDQFGLMYVRKRPIAAATTLEERLRYVLASTLAAAEKLEQEPELAARLKFNTDEFWIQSNDRLAAPNTAESYEALKPVLQLLTSAMDVYAPASLERVANSPQELLTIRIALSSPASLEALRQRVAVPLNEKVRRSKQALA